VAVTNTGKAAGKEIVQVYVHDRKSSLVRPAKELKGFAKVELQPGETKTVSISLDYRSFAFYHPAYKLWITEDGEFDLLIGASSADIRFTETVMLKSTLKLPSILNRNSTVREWQMDPCGKTVFEPVFEKLKAQMAAMFGENENGTNATGMNLMDFMLEMPPLNLLEFHESSLPMSASSLVDTLLAQVQGSTEKSPPSS
jgi:beta-glucosidase